MSKFVCYQCDSRVDHGCGDPFKMHQINRTVECADYCVKFFHSEGSSANDTFVRRGCLTDYTLYRLSKIDVCYRHAAGTNFSIGRFCMCGKEMCNDSTIDKFSLCLIIVIQLILFTRLKRIFF